MIQPGWYRQGRQVYSLDEHGLNIPMRKLVAADSPEHRVTGANDCSGLLLKRWRSKRASSMSPLSITASGSMLILLLLSGCGNKGALYLEADAESQRVLEQAEQEINEAVQTPGSEEPAEDTDESDEKKEKQQQ